jgi:hypothetical protein
MDYAAEAERRRKLLSLGITDFHSPEAMRASVDPEQVKAEQKREDVLEKEEQREIIKRFRAVGCDVWSTSSNKRAKIRPGFPDIWAFGPAGSNLAFWWESKRQKGGRLSEAQLDFQKRCKDSGTIHGYGDRYDAERFLIAHGLAYRGPGGALERTRQG